MKKYLPFLMLCLFVLTSCSDDSSLTRSSRGKNKGQQTTAPKTKKLIQPIVDNAKSEEIKNKYSDLNLEKIKLKLEYLARKERLSNLSYELAKTSKAKLADIKDDIALINLVMKELSKDLSPENLAEAKEISENEKQWIKPEITELSLQNITTSDGVRYKAVKLLDVCEIGVDIQHEKGVASLSYEIIPEKLRKECNYNPLAAYAFRKQRAEKQKQKLARLEAEKAEVEKQKKVLVKAYRAKLAEIRTEGKDKPSKTGANTSKIPELEFKPRKRTIKRSSSKSGCSPKG